MYMNKTMYWDVLNKRLKRKENWRGESQEDEEELGGPPVPRKESEKRQFDDFESIIAFANFPESSSASKA